jgi:MFS family permease
VRGTLDYRRDVSENQLGPVRQARVRRAPRYQAFVGAGVLLGLLVALVSGLTGPVDPTFGRGKLIGYLAIGFGLLGAMLGALVALGFERVGRRRR